MFRLLQGHQHGGTYKGIQVGQMCVCVVLKHSVVFVKYDTSLTEYVVLVYFCIYLSGDDLVEVKHVGAM